MNCSHRAFTWARMLRFIDGCHIWCFSKIARHVGLCTSVGRLFHRNHKSSSAILRSGALRHSTVHLLSIPIHFSLKAGQWLIQLIQSLPPPPPNSQDTSADFTCCPLVTGPVDLCAISTLFWHIELIVHIAISVLPGTDLHLSQMKHVYIIVLFRDPVLSISGQNKNDCNFHRKCLW